MECATPPAGAAGTVTFERLDPHTVRLHASGSPGFIVVLEGHHRDWRAEGPGGPVPLQPANDRYWALPTPGGEQLYTVRYEPAWVRPSILSCALASALTVLLVAAAQGAGGFAGKRPLQ